MQFIWVHETLYFFCSYFKLSVQDVNEEQVKSFQKARVYANVKTTQLLQESAFVSFLSGFAYDLSSYNTDAPSLHWDQAPRKDHDRSTMRL